MWTDMLEEVKKIPALVSDKGVEVQQTAHTRWIEARGQNAQRWYEFQISAMERAGLWLDDAPAWPVVGPVVDKAEEAVQKQLESLTTVPVEGFEGLSAKVLVATIRATSDRGVLRKVRWNEARGKSRKTVLEAVARRLEQLDRTECESFEPLVF